MSVNIEKGCWVCHHCGITGGLATGHDKPRVAHWNIPKYKKPEPRPDVRMANQDALYWLYKRGIGDAVIQRNKLEFVRVYMPQTEDFEDCIAFPYFRNGELINRKYRTIKDKNFRMEAGCELVLYGLDDIDEAGKLIWVEGEMDKLALETAGYANVVSVPNGAPAPKTKGYSSLFDFLQADWEKINAIKTHILAVDSDEAGQRLEDELRRRLRIDRCLRVRWPEGRKDANDVLELDGAPDLRYFIENAEAYPIEGVVEVDDVRDQIISLYESGMSKGVSTGWSNVDKLYTVKPGQLTVVTGIPSSGKSNWLDCLMVNIADEKEDGKGSGWRFAIFSPENYPVAQHVAYLAEKRARFPFNDGPSIRMTREMLDQALDWVRDHFVWIYPKDESDWEIDNILTIAGQMCLRYGIRGLVIDPWNEIEALHPAHVSETEHISQSLKKIRVFARERDIHVWIVVHPQKLYRADDGKYPVPTLYDCHGSAHWRNKADNGIVVWRDLSGQDSDEVEIHVQKVRFRQIGQRGKAVLYYNRTCATYLDSEGRRGYDRD
jgi:twinkle protein